MPRAYGAQPYAAYSGPPNKSDTLARQLASLPLMLLLYTASVPFTPVAWFLNLYESTVFDRLFGGIAIMAACYFQWRIAGLSRPLPVLLSVPSATTTTAAAVGFVWHPDNYWPYAALEALLLCVAQFGPSEALRRGVVCGVVGALWMVGFAATPEPTKRWAYERFKAWMFWMVLDELLRAGSRGYGPRRRRY